MWIHDVISVTSQQVFKLANILSWDELLLWVLCGEVFESGQLVLWDTIRFRHHKSWNRALLIPPLHSSSFYCGLSNSLSILLQRIDEWPLPSPVRGPTLVLWFQVRGSMTACEAKKRRVDSSLHYCRSELATKSWHHPDGWILLVQRLLTNVSIGEKRR